MKVVLLAAGYATRLRPLTDDRPKHLLPVGGRPMLDWVLDRVDELDEVDGIHLVTIATLNGLLWILALRGRSDATMMATALFPILVFVIGTAVASVSPAVAQFTWCLGFLAPFAGWLAGRRER